MDLFSNNQPARGITFEVAKSHEQLSQKAATLILEIVRQKPDLLLCLASGSTPTRSYERLAAQRQAKSTFQRVQIVKLDEWGGVDMNNPITCEQYLQRHVLDPLDIPPDRYEGFNSNSADPSSECARIERWITRNGPIDLCVLGIGTNGHIAFNEPGRALQPFSHVATLSDHSLQHPMLQASEHPPQYGLTLGMAEIMQARRILLLVSGSHKQAVLQQLCEREISSQLPASFLWLHPNVVCLCDEDAAKGISPLSAQ